MRKLLLITVLACLVSGSAWGAGVAMDHLLARRLANIMENADADPEAALAGLEKLYNRWHHQPAQQVFVLQERVGLLLQAERFDPARRELLAFLNDQPMGFALNLRLALAQVQLVLEDLNGAMKTLEGWRGAVEKPTGQGLFLLGYAYMRGDRLTEAVGVLEQAVASRPKPLPIWVELLAYTYGRVGRGDEAVALMVSLIQRFPERERWWRQLAALFQSIDRPQSGAAAYAVIREFESLTRNEIRQIAKLYAYLGMPYDGAQWLTAAKQAEGQNLADLMLLAELWISARETDKAMAVLNEAEALAEDGKPSLIRGQLLLHWERYQEAAELLAQSVAKYGEAAPPNAWYFLAVAQANLNQPEAARAALMRVEGEAHARRVKSLSRYIDSLALVTE